MNKRVSRLLTGIACVLALSSCSDKDNAPLPDLSSEKTFTGNNLKLYYNGELMPGKTARVKVVDGKAEMNFYCDFDLSQLTGMGLTGSLAGPGITPGDVTITLSAPVEAGRGEYTFKGSSETDYVTFTFSGSFGDDSMTMYLNDCKLKNPIYAGNVFEPAPIKKEGLLEYSSIPFHLVWEIDPASGIDIPLSDILKAAVTVPVIPVYNNTAYTSVAEAFENLIKTIALTDSGNIPVMYVSTLGGAAHIATTSGNMMQYIPASNGIKLYLNPLSVVGEVLLATSDNKNDDKFDFEQMLKRSQRADSSSEGSNGPAISDSIDPELKKALISVLLKAFAPQIANGIPLTVAPTATGADIYLDTATSVIFMATVLQDMMQNQVIITAIQNALASAQLPELDPTEVADIIQKLPVILTQTTKLEIGLSLVKKQ